MAHKVRMLLAAVLITFAVLGTGWTATNVPPVYLAAEPPGGNGG